MWPNGGVQWFWIEVAEHGTVLSANVINLAADKTITWNGKSCGGTWDYRYTGNDGIFYLEFSARGSRHARKHAFTQLSDTTALLLPTNHLAYTEYPSWKQTSYLHENTNQIMIQKIDIPNPFMPTASQ